MTCAPRAWPLLGLLVMTLNSGCVREQAPAQTFRRWLSLINAGRLADAHRLMSSSYRQRCDLVCFSRSVAAEADELRRLHLQVQAALPTTQLRATVETGQGEPPLYLVKDPGGPWQLGANPLDFYPQDTPAAALRSFERAVAARRYDVLLGFMPQRLREGATAARLKERWEGPDRAALMAQLAQVRRHLGEPPVIEGNEARLPVGEDKVARLVLEEGRWRVLQLQ
jgi:hypothetical protein